MNIEALFNVVESIIKLNSPRYINEEKAIYQRSMLKK